MTNYHVIDGASSIEVYTAENYAYEVKGIISYDEEYDIAILQLEEHTNLRPLTAGNSSTVKKGDEVVAIGSPEGLQNSVSTGVLSGRVESILQFTAPISHGSSGGALFDSSGRVIGVTFASYETGQALNFAIPIEYVITLFNSR